MRGFFNLVLFVLVWLVVILTTSGFGLLLFAPYWYLVIYNSDGRAQKADEKLKSALMEGEAVVAQGLQLRVFSLFLRRHLVAITNSRIIVIKRSILGGFNMLDHQWKDLRDARYDENIIPNIFGAQLRFRVIKSDALFVDGIPSNIASKIYARAQSEEQAWEEKNRIRLMEQQRAASGGTVVKIDGPNASSSDKLSKSDDSLFENLEKIKKLHDGGLINDAEFNELKSKILSSATNSL
jgi:hypothetical protein